MNSKKLTKYALFGVAAAMASLTAQAETVYWTGESVYNAEWKSGSSEDAANYSTGAKPSAADDLVFDAGKLTGDAKNLFQPAAVLDVNSITINEGYVSGRMEFRFNSWSKIKVAGDFNFFQRGGQFNFQGSGSGANTPSLVVGGNLVLGSADTTSDSRATYKFTAGRDNETTGWGPVEVKAQGNLVLNKSVNALFDGRTKTVFDVTNDNAATAAQVYFGGTINFVRENDSENPNLSLVSRDSAGATVGASTINVVSSNGVNGKGTISSTGNTDASKSYVGVLHLRNSSEQVFDGWVYDGANAKTMIVMEASDPLGAQRFTGNNLAFSGGVIVRNGTLDLRTHGLDTWVTKDSSLSHGKLTMSGGTLKITGINGSVKQFGFDSVEYDGGTIDLTILGETDSGLKLHSANDSGTSFDFGSEVTGYTIVDFYLTGEGIDLTDGREYRIIEWTSKSSLSADKFQANSIGDFEAEFDVRDDGLYVKYVNAVPEPATVAAVFGLAALGFALYRRRRQC